MVLSHEHGRIDGVPVLQVSGEVDLSSAAALERAIGQLLDDGSPLVVVDITCVTFLDSAGLKVLDDAQRAADGCDSRLAVVCPHERLLRLFEITGLDDRLSIHSTAETAARRG